MIVYFDTNVFDHLEQRNGVTDWDFYRLQRAISQGVFRLALAPLTIEETLFLVPLQPARAARRIKLMLELCDKSLPALDAKGDSIWLQDRSSMPPFFRRKPI